MLPCVFGFLHIFVRCQEYKQQHREWFLLSLVVSAPGHTADPEQLAPDIGDVQTERVLCLGPQWCLLSVT